MSDVAQILEGRTEKAKRSIALLAKQEKERRRKENPLKYFVPNLPQEELIRAVGNKTDKFIYVFAAGNSCGKSAGALTILGNIIFGIQSDWFDLPRFRNWEGPKKAWYLSEHTSLKEFVCGVDERSEVEIRKWFPKGRYDFTKAGLEYYSHLVTDTGWTVAFRSYDQAVAKFESDKVSLVITDEPPPEGIYNALLARLTMGGIIMIPMTPLYSAAWVKDRIVDNASETSDKEVIYADIHQNCRDCYPRGILAHKQIERIVSNYDEEEREAREKGTFMHLSGLIFRNLHHSYHRHNNAPEVYQQDEYLIYNVIDPHDAKPPMIGWYAVSPWGSVDVIEEFPKEPFHLLKTTDMTTLDICKEIMRVEQDCGWNPKYITRVMDPNFGKKPSRDAGLTVRDTFAKYGREDLNGYPLFYNTEVNDSIEAGHRLIRDFLKLRKVDGGKEEPRLRIGINCTNHWTCLTRYSYIRDPDKRLETHGMSGRVSEKFKHAIDLMRYLLMFYAPPKFDDMKRRPEHEEEYYKLIQSQGGGGKKHFTNPRYF